MSRYWFLISISQGIYDDDVYCPKAALKGCFWGLMIKECFSELSPYNVQIWVFILPRIEKKTGLYRESNPCLTLCETEILTPSTTYCSSFKCAYLQRFLDMPSMYLIGLGWRKLLIWWNCNTHQVLFNHQQHRSNTNMLNYFTHKPHMMCSSLVPVIM